jgi:hypothetical protein
MHLRRALILFAVVLGLAALAASVSQPRRDQERREPPPSAPGTPEAAPGPGGPRPARLRFSQRGKPATRRLRAGRPAMVSVEVSEPGQVDVEGLGLTAPAEPLTPARFDLLADEPGAYEVRYTPAGRDESEVVGTLKVVDEPAT